MRKTKVVLIFIMLIMIASFALTSCKGDFDVHKASEEICLLMEEKTRSEDYWHLRISGTEQSFEEYREKYMANDYDRPIRCYKITPEDLSVAVSKLMYVDKNDEEHYGNLSNSLKEDIENEYKNGFIMMKAIVNRVKWEGGDYGMGSNACDTSRDFEDYKTEDTTAYLYIFETGKPIIIIYGNQNDSAVSAYGTFILNSEYKTLSEVRDIFEPFGCSVEIEFEN